MFLAYLNKLFLFGLRALHDPTNGRAKTFVSGMSAAKRLFVYGKVRITKARYAKDSHGKEKRGLDKIYITSPTFFSFECFSDI